MKQLTLKATQNRAGFVLQKVQQLHLRTKARSELSFRAGDKNLGTAAAPPENPFKGNRIFSMLA